MFDVNGSFSRFLTALQVRTKLAFNLSALSERACLLKAQPFSVDIVFYRCLEGGRISVSSDKRCIHIDEDSWTTKPELVLNRIIAVTGSARRVHARETVAARIGKHEALAFQNEHHLHVPLPGKYRYGLFLRGELVTIAVFSGGRRLNGMPADYRSFELLRFCHKQGFRVVGGLGKLLDAFQREFDPGDIMTYADKDWADGTNYRKTGFEFAGEIAPQLFWVDTGSMKRYYERTLPSAIAALSAEERKQAGFTPIENGGSIKLIKPFRQPLDYLKS